MLDGCVWFDVLDGLNRVELEEFRDYVLEEMVDEEMREDMDQPLYPILSFIKMMIERKA